MGDLQTYFYLALISAIMVSLTLLFVGLVVRSLRRWARQGQGHTPLIFWLVSGAVTVVFLFIVVGTAGVLYGFIRYGTS
ncbi:MAG TPA: hypothetical protein VFR68_13075 [Candidatus Dormibacteraeota bacterium]|nr:hypothetical protein [Candidatus Dormibacteraeota bacterium]